MGVSDCVAVLEMDRVRAAVTVAAGVPDAVAPFVCEPVLDAVEFAVPAAEVLAVTLGVARVDGETGSQADETGGNTIPRNVLPGVAAMRAVRAVVTVLIDHSAFAVTAYSTQAPEADVSIRPFTLSTAAPVSRL